MSSQAKGQRHAFGLSLHDKDLLAAKVEKRKVRVWIASETVFAPECEFIGTVLEVDRYAVKFQIDGWSPIWVTKQCIAATL